MKLKSFANKTINIIFILITVYYFYYNSPVYKQLIAHFIYKEVAALEVSSAKNQFNCMSVNVNRVDTLLDQNKFILRGGSMDLKSYKYKVNELFYENNKHSYIKNNIFACGQKIEKAYYFPLIPQFSVIDRRFPDQIYWDRFQVTTKCMAMIALYMFLYMLMRYRFRDE